MPRVEVTGKAQMVKVFIDGSKVTLANSKGGREIPAGEHVISWNVRGVPGSGYSVQITAPAAAAFKKEAKFDDSQFDAGVHFFKV
jgi:hypothetical protein